MDPAQALARNGRHRRGRVHARPAAHNQDERRVLRVDEGRKPLIARARIAAIARLESGVSLVTLTLIDEFRFRAGQYVNVLHPGGARIPMSIASAPERLPQLELHFRPLPGVPEAQLMHEILRRAADGSRDIEIDGPLGNVCVDGPVAQELLLIAGGSGIAQCRSIAAHLQCKQQTHAVQLLWSVTAANQLYCDEELRGFPRWLHYNALIDVPNSQSAAVVWLRRATAPPSGRVIISGGPGFVYAVADALTEIGAPVTSVESDVFSYAPRRSR